MKVSSNTLLLLAAAGVGVLMFTPAIGVGMKLTAQQIAVYAQTAGFTGDDLMVAVAVALAESGGDPNAYNPETAAGTPSEQGSYGLWQIYRKVHPEFDGWNLNDPATNARAAFAVYSAAGGNFTPWATYTGNAYEAFLPAAGGTVNA